MPKYRVIELSYINDRLVQPGEIVEYDGNPSWNLEPTCDEGWAAREAWERSEEIARKQRAGILAADPVLAREPALTGEFAGLNDIVQAEREAAARDAASPAVRKPQKRVDPLV